jgi:glycine reductase complex component B subunit gamma
MAANDKLRVVHYLNQFFGQIGGEEKAGAEPMVKPGPVGPGLALQEALGENGEVVATVICGDNYVADNLDKATDEIIKLIKEQKPDAVVTGPAFNAGRYGMACGAVGQAVAVDLGLPVVSGMYLENPGVELYRKSLYIIPTADSARGMREALPPMVALLMKLVRGEELGSPEEEGYLPRGIRFNSFASENGAQRAVKMLIAKLKGEPFTTELPMPDFDRVTPNPPVADMGKATIALVTSGGIVPKGNPDRIESSSASKYGKYSLEGFTDLTSETHETAHGGYDPVYANQDPDRVLPLDVMRDLEAEGVIGKLHPYHYATVGNGTSVANAAKYGAAIAVDLKEAGVDAVILTST